MSTHSTTIISRPFTARAILVGGLLAGSLDAASAFMTFGWKMPYGIASGLLDAKANPALGAGQWVWVLGLALHYFIALSAAGIYVVASRRLSFLKENFVVCGIFFGTAVYLVMNTVVLPWSAVPFPVGPFTVKAIRLGIFYHVLLIGLPISISTWFFSRKERES